MIKSMTGYGKKYLSKDSRTYIIEIKSVNHRYLDITVKMPRAIAYLEDEVKKEISKKIKRGKIDVYIAFEDTISQTKQIKLNTNIAKIYIEQLKELAEEENIPSNIELTEIVKLPDVLSIQDTQEDETIKQELIQITNEATQSLLQMREAEGSKMEQDILNRLETINTKNKEISILSTGLIQEYVVKLEGRIKEIIKNQDIDENRLAQEVVIYADKCSIEEEVTRLNSHILQFKEFLKTEGAIGKKLDFLVQEMNRETNTIGSKANNTEIVNDVIEIKTELENIREQIQNIE